MQRKEYVLGKKKNGVCNKHQVGGKLIWILVLPTSLFWGKVFGKLLNLSMSHISPETETKKKKKKGTVLGTLFMIALSKDNPRY